MKRHILLAPAAVAVISLMTSITAAQPAARLTKWQQYQQSLYKTSAPADEYFGHQKLSYLGINNSLRYETALAGDHTTDPGIISTVSRVDEALRAWAVKYPSDPQLARSYFLAIHTYTKIWTQPYQEKAWQYFHELVQRFPRSYFAKQVKRDLSVGFTEHYYAEPLLCPTPSPSPTASPSPTPEPKRGRKAAPTPTPEPTESPTAEPTESPTPQPTPTPGPNQPKVEILTPPCVQALTPSPTPYVPSIPAITAAPLPSGATPPPISSPVISPAAPAPITTPAQGNMH